MNKIILMGRLVADPELRYTQSNIPVCRFRIAVDRPFQKEGEERQADFFNVTAWRQTGEFVSKYFRKGSRILVEGWLMNNNYEDNQGVKHYSVDVQAERVYFADSKKADDSGQTPQSQGHQATANDNPPWNEPVDDFPKTNPAPQQQAAQPAPQQNINDSTPPWMR